MLRRLGFSVVEYDAVAALSDIGTSTREPRPAEA
jgi:hypothetical protein